MNSKTIKKEKKILLLCLIIISFSYIFRGIIAKLGIGVVFYGITMLVFLICCGHKLYCPKSTKNILYFIVIGMICALLTIVTYKSITLGIVGFVASYSNLLVWMAFFCILKKTEIEFVKNKYINVFLFFGFVTVVLAIYQIFFDASIFGLATDYIYSNESLLSSGRFVRRATALLGSAQNYGFFVAIVFCVLFFKEESSLKKTILLILTAIGIFISGSRSASAGMICALIVKLVEQIKKRKIKIGAGKIVGLLVVMAVFVALSKRLLSNMDLRAVERLFDFNTSASRSVYSELLKSLDFKSLMIGRGLGYRSWSTNELLGIAYYQNVFGESYTSIESYFLQTFFQMGIFGLLLIITVMIKSLLISYRRNDYQSVAVLICVIINQVFTPSFAGMAMSFVMWPFILIPFFEKNY